MYDTNSIWKWFIDYQMSSLNKNYRIACNLIKYSCLIGGEGVSGEIDILIFYQ